MNTLRRLALPLCTLLLGLAPAAPDASLDNLWFKARVTATGYVIQPDGLVPHRFSGSETVYVHLALDTSAPAPGAGDDLSLPSTTYRYEVWTQSSPGNWSMTYSDTESVESTDGRMFFVVDTYYSLHSQSGGYLEAYMTCAIKVKRDKAGQVKSASLVSLGGEIFNGTFDGDDTVRGGVSLKGKTVKATKLPFTP